MVGLDAPLPGHSEKIIGRLIDDACKISSIDPKMDLCFGLSLEIIRKPEI
jgi:hypothetical protein